MKTRTLLAAALVAVAVIVTTKIATAEYVNDNFIWPYAEVVFPTYNPVTIKEFDVDALIKEILL